MITQRLAVTSLVFAALLAQGTVQIEPALATRQMPTAWTNETVDTTGQVWRGNSLALDADDNPHISYYDVTLGAVKYAFQDQAGWHVETVDGDVSDYNGKTSISLALDSQGQPQLSYTDATSRAVRYAFRSGSTWHIETIDPQAGQRTSVALALDVSGIPHVAYQVDGQGYPMVIATRDDTGWHLEVVAAGGVYSRANPALVFDAAGSPKLAFVAYTTTGKGVTVATRDPGASAWNQELVAAVDSGDYSLAMAMDADGIPHIAWGSSDPPDRGTVHHGVRVATGWRVETVDAGGDMTGIALSIDPDGHPFIAVSDIGFDSFAGVYYLVQLRVCYRDAAGWHVEIPELSEQRPYSPSLALDHAGRPHISYYDAANGELRLVVRTAPPPMTSTPPANLPWQATCIDCPRAFDSMADHSLRADGQGRLHMAYGGDHLYYATFDGVTWQSVVADPAPGVGQGASLALDASGVASIAYYDALNGDLKFAWLEGGAWQNETVESAGDVGKLASLAIDQAGNPHIGYYDRSQQLLRYATRSAQGWRLETVSEEEISSISLALFVDGRPNIAFAGAGLWCAYRDATGWQLEAVGDPQAYGSPVSLAIDSTGRPHIAFGRSDGLQYARWDTAGWQVYSVLQGGAQSVSLALDSADVPHISYRHRRDQYREYELRHVTRQASGSTWTTETVDTSDALSDKLVSLTVDGAGAAHIVYLVENILTLASQGPQGGWRLQVVDESSSAEGSDLALDGSAQVYTSYSTSGAREGRWYAVGDGMRWQREEVVSSLEAISQLNNQSSASPGRSIIVDANGAPHLAYASLYRISIYPPDYRWDLWYAHRDTATGQWSVEKPGEGAGPAMALDTNGTPHICYVTTSEYPPYQSDLIYAVSCGNGWCREVADSGGSGYYLGRGASMVVDAEGWPHVSYLGYNVFGYERQLRLATKDATGWHAEVVAEYVETRDTTTSLALNTAGRPMIAFAQNYDLVLAIKDGEEWHYEIVDGAGSVSGSIELALDSQGQPHIGYFNNGRLRYALRTDRGWQLHDVNPAGLLTGQSAGFVLGPDDTPYFAITDPWRQDYLLVTTASPTARIWLPLLYKQ